MHRRIIAGLFLVAAAFPPPAAARIERVEILSRQPFAGGAEFGRAGAYEKLRGRAFFALDPNAAANQPIADLALAPRDGRGLVEFSAEFLVLRPAAPARGNGTLLYEVNNRGNIGMLRQLDEASFSNDPATAADAGNGFLFRHGFTLAWSAWASDVATTPGDNRLVLRAPVATKDGAPITGKVAYELIVDAPRTTARFTGLLGTAYAPASAGAPDAVLTERDRPDGEAELIPRSAWSLVAPKDGAAATEITLAGGFKPGRIYQLVYTARDPTVVAVGMAGIRDLLSYLRDNPLAGGPAPQRSLIFGISQSGRLIQTMLLRGLNVDEDGKPVFDGAFIHVAGGGKGSFDFRFAMPTRHFSMLEDHIYPTDFFPFTTVTARDPETGAEGAVLDRARALGAVPKLFYVNNSSEYWNRAASLIATDPAGERDLPPAPEARIYMIAGAQHYVGVLRERGIFANCVNTLNHYRVMRALAPRAGRLGARRNRAAAEHLSAHRRRHAGHARRPARDVPADCELPPAREQSAPAAPRPRRPVRNRARRRPGAAGHGRTVRDTGPAAGCRRQRPGRHFASGAAGAARHPDRFQHSQRCRRFPLGHRPLGWLVPAVCADRGGAAGRRRSTPLARGALCRPRRV